MTSLHVVQVARTVGSWPENSLNPAKWNQGFQVLARARPLTLACPVPMFLTENCSTGHVILIYHRSLACEPTVKTPEFWSSFRPAVLARTTMAASAKVTTRWANSVLALRASTGKFVWGFQVVHHTS